MEHNIIKRIGRRAALTVLLLFSAIANYSLFTLHSSLLHSSLLHAQGLPLIRNYTAAEYGGHNRCYDIEIGENGSVFVANFDGLLCYDRSRWRTILTPGISRATVVYRASDNTIWVGGYNFIARLRLHNNGDLYLEQGGKSGRINGEVLEILEDGGHLLCIVSDNNIYEVKGGTGKEPPTLTLKQHLHTNFSISVDAETVSVDAVKAGKNDVMLEDITQTVFFKAWRALPDFRGDAAFSSWLYRLTVNASTDFLRSRREPPLSLDDPDLPQPAHPGPEPFDAARETERREALVQAVHALPEQARTILLLREMDGLSYEEISDALEVPMGTVRSRLARARRALGSLLREQGNLWDEEPSNPEKEPSEGGTDREP